MPIQCVPASTVMPAERNSTSRTTAGNDYAEFHHKNKICCWTTCLRQKFKVHVPGMLSLMVPAASRYPPSAAARAFHLNAMD
jgi:hypothetical protein